MRKKVGLASFALAGLLAVSPVMVPVTDVKPVHAATQSVFYNKQFNLSDLVNGKVLQQNPYVVVTSTTGMDVRKNDLYVFVLEYVGKGYTGTGLFVTYWKSERVSTKDGSVIDIQISIVNFPVDSFPHLKPPSDGQGVDFGNQQPANGVWATGVGTNVTEIPGWKPTVKTPPISGFSDVTDDNPYAQYVAYLKAKGVVNGVGDGKFGPFDQLTRAQFAKMMVEAFGISQSDNASKFADTNGHWAARYIQGAYEAKVINGTSETTFEPDTRVRREEAATMVWRYLKTQSVQPIQDTINLSGKTDEWAIEAVKNVIGYKLHGPDVSKYRDGSYSYGSQETMDRQEAAALIAMAMQKLGR